MLVSNSQVKSISIKYVVSTRTQKYISKHKQHGRQVRSTDLTSTVDLSELYRLRNCAQYKKAKWPSGLLPQCEVNTVQYSGHAHDPGIAVKDAQDPAPSQLRWEVAVQNGEEHHDDIQHDSLKDRSGELSTAQMIQWSGI